MKKYTDILRAIKPYNGIIYFLIVLFATHFLWKFVVDGDMNSQHIAIFGKDLTPLFYRLSQWTNQAVFWFAGLFPGTENLSINDTLISFTDSNFRLRIIWGCTGVKQLYIFIAIIALYYGPWKKKLWYIPLGCILLSAFNIIRITAILFLTHHHSERFEFLHDQLFRYMYYGIIFLLWVYWEEKVRKPKIAE